MFFILFYHENIFNNLRSAKKKHPYLLMTKDEYFLHRIEYVMLSNGRLVPFESRSASHIKSLLFLNNKEMFVTCVISF